MNHNHSSKSGRKLNDAKLLTPAESPQEEEEGVFMYNTILYKLDLTLYGAIDMAFAKSSRVCRHGNISQLHMAVTTFCFTSSSPAVNTVPWQLSPTPLHCTDALEDDEDDMFPEDGL